LKKERERFRGAERGGNKTIKEFTKRAQKKAGNLVRRGKVPKRRKKRRREGRSFIGTKVRVGWGQKNWGGGGRGGGKGGGGGVPKSACGACLVTGGMGDIELVARCDSDGPAGDQRLSHFPRFS